MPLDDTHIPRDDDDHSSEHEGIEAFAESVLDAMVNAIVENEKCIACTTYIVSIRSLAAWLAASIAAEAGMGRIESTDIKHAHKEINKEVSRMISYLMIEYTDAMTKLEASNGR